MKPYLASLAALIAIVGQLPYLISVIRQEIRPHPYTWLIWSIVSGVTFVGQVTKGAGWATLAFGASEIFTVLIFLFSLRFGFGNIPKKDTYFLIAALLGIIPWIVFRDPTISVIIMVTIDFIAFVPTYKKAWVEPRSEKPVLYTSNVIRHALALASLGSYNVATMLHSIVMIVTNTFMTGIILSRHDQGKK